MLFEQKGADVFVASVRSFVRSFVLSLQFQKPLSLAKI